MVNIFPTHKFGSVNDGEVLERASLLLHGERDQNISPLRWEALVEKNQNKALSYLLSPTQLEIPSHLPAIPVREVIIDSDLSICEALRSVPEKCPPNILAALELVRVFYFSDDARVHTGQVLIHHSLAQDTIGLFNEVILAHKIPVGPMKPIAEYEWDDYKSMQANAGHSFNFRSILTPTGEKKTLSLHALGLALDISPQKNPCYDGGEVVIPDFLGKDSAAGYRAKLPHNGEYSLEYAGSFHDRHPVVVFLQSRGWTWGGSWGFPKDLHHFQKIPQALAEEVKQIRSAS